MKIAKIALLLYNSILIFSLITIGFVASSYQDLAPVLLLLPVGIYFNLSLINQVTKLAHFVKNPKVHRLKRFLRSYSLVVIVLFVFSSMASSSSFFQFVLIIFFLPLMAYFWLELFNKKARAEFILNKKIAVSKFFSLMKKTPKPKEEPVEGELVNQEEVTEKDSDESQGLEEYMEEEGMVSEGMENIFDVKDKKRRQFLRVIGGGGVSLFLTLFVFQKKASAAFFGSAPGPGIVGIKDIAGDKIDPAEKQPTDGYNISEVDDASSPAYYGFVHKEGAWYVAKEDSSGAYRYVSGPSSFSTSWTNRASLTYDYFDNIF